jgi:tetratricopeptide (TPR) repeat protein/tRNA A-37 threonylcarbamoyl transferase component Bud32
MLKISPEDWREVFTLLDTALDLPVAERADWLASLRDRPAHITIAIRELLARQTSEEFLRQLPRFTGSQYQSDLDGSPEPLQVGSIVGPYRLIERLGRGGMSTVWVAERIDGMLKRRIAIKLPHVSWAIPEAARRMARERDLLSSLEHPHIARLYDAGVGADERPYLALELVDGRPIDVYCADRRIDIPTRVAAVLQTARAVAYAHARSIIHRDLKPSNILVDAAGEVHLLDFGIGKLLEPDTAVPADETQVGHRLFTPDYASPEQLRGDAISASSDVFSLGVVLYQILCGKLPFPTRRALLDIRAPSAMCHDKPTSHVLRGDLDTITLKALKELPSERFSSMAAFADDLARYLRGEPVLAQPDSAAYRVRKFASRNGLVLRAAGLAVLVTSAIGTAVALYQSARHDSATLRALDLSADQMAQRALPQSPPTRDVVAYREYLQARSLMLRPTEENLREILRLAESATARDPGFAHAFALLSGANVLFLDIGYAHADALTRGEPAARRALELNPRLPGAHATLGSIAAHRGQWALAEAHFKDAFDFDDQSGRIHARRAQVVLMSMGRLELAREEFLAEFRLTPGHARGAMQVATALILLAGREAEALKYVDIAMSLGWPADANDITTLYGHEARRAGRHREAIEYQTLALPEGLRDAQGVGLVAKLYAALAAPMSREPALIALDDVTARLKGVGTSSFHSLMFAMNWYVMLGDLDRAFAASDQWLQLSRLTGLSGIPHNAGFWLPEMRAFRADVRFGRLATDLGLTGYWRRFGPPDHCTMGETLVCRR